MSLVRLHTLVTTALGLVVYLARLRSVFHREPGPGVPRDIED